MKYRNKKLHEIASYLDLISTPKEEMEVEESKTEDEAMETEAGDDDDSNAEYKTNYLLEVLVSHHERRTSQLESLNEMPLYPTEQIIWDENIVPMEFFSGEGCLALPKLHLQFLTLHDYLLRNFNLFRLESTCKFMLLKSDI